MLQPTGGTEAEAKRMRREFQLELEEQLAL